MIDLTLSSSDDENPPQKRARGKLVATACQSDSPATRQRPRTRPCASARTPPARRIPARVPQTIPLPRTCQSQATLLPATQVRHLPTALQPAVLPQRATSHPPEPPPRSGKYRNHLPTATTPRRTLSQQLHPATHPASAMTMTTTPSWRNSYACPFAQQQQDKQQQQQ